MASADELKEFDRKAQGRFVAPVPPPPKFPQNLWKLPVPQREKAIEKWNKEMEDWRTNLGPLPVDTQVSKGAQGLQGQQGKQGIQGPAGPAGTSTVAQPAQVSPQVIQEIVPEITLVELGLQKKVFIGVRTDGRPGTGKLSDPFDGSTVDKFDAIMNDATKIFPYSEIILLPGVFYTRGWSPARDALAWRLRPGTRFRGCGMRVTTLKLFGAAAASDMYTMLKATFYDFGARDTFFNPAAVEYYNDIEVSDLTLDADFLNQPANIPTPTLCTHGIHIVGGNIKIARVRFVHFGSANAINEAFVCAIGEAVAYVGWGDRYDLAVEDCVFELVDYNTLPSGLTCLAIIGGESLPDGSQAWEYNVSIRNNRIDSKFSDGFVPYSSVHPSYPVARKLPVALQWATGYNISIEGNQLVNGAYMYADTWNNKFVTFRGNQIYNAPAGLYINYGGSSPNTGLKFTIEKLVFENNDIALQRATQFSNMYTSIGGVQITDYLDSNSTLFKTVIIRGNRIHLTDDSASASDVVGGAILVTNAEDLQLEDNVIQLPNSTLTPSARGSIYLRKIQRLNARNNRRPEDNSIIVPYLVDQTRWLSDSDYEAEKAAVRACYA